MIELRGPSRTIYMVEEGVVDERAMAAFRLGQCHGLALAIAARTGWELVAIIADDATCSHICTRRPDGQLMDITGAHKTEEVKASSPGCTIVAVELAEIDRLVMEKGWAPPDVEAAKSFVTPVLAIAKREPWQGSKMRTIRKVGPTELKFIWQGFAWVAIYIRRRPANGINWGFYGELRLPMDPIRNAYVIDFTPAEFKRLVDDWVADRGLELSHQVGTTHRSDLGRVDPFRL